MAHLRFQGISDDWFSALWISSWITLLAVSKGPCASHEDMTLFENEGVIAGLLRKLGCTARQATRRAAAAGAGDRTVA
jgi:hypothetical protein